MSDRLREIIQCHLVKAGKEGRARLCLEAEISLSTLSGYLGKRAHQSTPRPETAYRVALACGCTQEEALELSKECSSEAKENTA
jgi:hypothetical protein